MGLNDQGQYNFSHITYLQPDSWYSGGKRLKEWGILPHKLTPSSLQQLKVVYCVMYTSFSPLSFLVCMFSTNHSPTGRAVDTGWERNNLCYRTENQ